MRRCHVLYLQAAMWRACISGETAPSKFEPVNGCGYISEGILAMFQVMQLNISVVIFALGLVFWALRYVFQYGCNAAFGALFSNFGTIVAAACLGFASVGLPDYVICNADLINVSDFLTDKQLLPTKDLLPHQMNMVEA